MDCYVELNWSIQAHLDVSYCLYLRSWQQVGGEERGGSRVNCWIVVVVVELAALVAGSVAMSVAGSVAMLVAGWVAMLVAGWVAMSVAGLVAMLVVGSVTMSAAGSVVGGADLFKQIASFFWKEEWCALEHYVRTL